MSVLMDKIWELQEDEKISIEDRINMVQKAGDDVRNLIKTYTGIDTFDLYKDEKGSDNQGQSELLNQWSGAQTNTDEVGQRVTDYQRK